MLQMVSGGLKCPIARHPTSISSTRKHQLAENGINKKKSVSEVSDQFTISQTKSKYLKNATK